jgi:hypothetical protein
MEMNFDIRAPLIPEPVFEDVILVDIFLSLPYSTIKLS